MWWSSGHAPAGGCMVALAHDYRFMSSDRGFLFLSEVRHNACYHKFTTNDLDVRQLFSEGKKQKLLGRIPKIGVQISYCTHLHVTRSSSYGFQDIRVGLSARSTIRWMNVISPARLTHLRILLWQVDISMPLSPGMNALIQAKIPGSAFYKAVLSGYADSSLYWKACLQRLMLSLWKQNQLMLKWNRWSNFSFLKWMFSRFSEQVSIKDVNLSSDLVDDIVNVQS